MVKAKAGASRAAAAAKQQPSSVLEGGAIKPNRPPTEYEVRVYKVNRLLHAAGTAHAKWHAQVDMLREAA
jgi:hypothetical protein